MYVKEIRRRWFIALLACLMLVIGSLALQGVLAMMADRPMELSSWKTNWTRYSVDRSELQSGGPGKDGIPALLEPRFVTVDQARQWVEDSEPVIHLHIGSRHRAYPLQILIWHEIVNDTVGDIPVAATFCPLCYSGLVFDRRVAERTVTLGVSGFLRHSDMVMYDHQTESLWQQFTGEALIGDLVGHRLRQLPGQIMSFRQFASLAPEGRVLSRETGHRRDYGRNPYRGYDTIESKPFMYQGPYDGRLAPMERVVGVTLGGKSRAYAYRYLNQVHVVNEVWAGQTLAVFWQSGTRSALDQPAIAESRDVGATGVFDRRVGDLVLTFRSQGTHFVDHQTGSTWTLAGRATAGPLAGTQMDRVPHGDYFAFAFLVFYPAAEVASAPQ